ncbi:17221_t:CDS:2 [Cetraspora pellucida]|uniref:17221_t:CDS:1 n=1 Tax=Cetraspora pellucida TaxID=1433469 RepID=A0A9N9E6W6_9GLOM|nr:17221_t:CDS:2 [Cetraspora pellucida]
MQKNNIVINTETLFLEEENIDDFTENMISKETTISNKENQQEELEQIA